MFAQRANPHVAVRAELCAHIGTLAVEQLSVNEMYYANETNTILCQADAGWSGAAMPW